MQINFYLPLPIVYLIATMLVIALWAGIGIAIGSVLDKMLRRHNGDTLIEDKYLFWVNLLLTGPFGWYVTLTNMEAVKRGRQRGRERRKLRREAQPA